MRREMKKVYLLIEAEYPDEKSFPEPEQYHPRIESTEDAYWDLLSPLIIGIYPANPAA